jgi:hypothetical protein
MTAACMASRDVGWVSGERTLGLWLVVLARNVRDALLSLPYLLVQVVDHFIVDSAHSAL